MKTCYGHAAAALLLLAGTHTAGAQWEPRTVVTTQPLPLTQSQRTTIYRTIIPQGRGRGPIIRERIVTESVPAPIVRERVVTPSLDAYAYGDPGPAPFVNRRIVAEADAYGAYAYVGAPPPPQARLLPMPPRIVAEVPAVRSYRYMVIGERVFLVDPASGLVVAEVRP